MTMTFGTFVKQNFFLNMTECQSVKGKWIISFSYILVIKTLIVTVALAVLQSRTVTYPEDAQICNPRKSLTDQYQMPMQKYTHQRNMQLKKKKNSKHLLSGQQIIVGTVNIIQLKKKKTEKDEKELLGET